jgi:hypothetical protein
MSFDLDKILESKRAMRKHLAALPIKEKLQMLDDLQERALLIREAMKLTGREASTKPSDGS